MNILCTVCEDVTPTKHLETFTLKTNKRAIKGLCTLCDSNKILLLGKEGGKLFPGELHLPNHNYTGPFTRTDLRLNEDLSPKSWSIPINKVDEASLKHDIKYIDKSLEARHKADDEMIQELNNIENPTFREKVERSIIIPTLQTKRFIGLGLSPVKYRDFI